MFTIIFIIKHYCFESVADAKNGYKFISSLCAFLFAMGFYRSLHHKVERTTYFSTT